MANLFQLRVMTAEGTALDTPVSYCNLQTPEGSLGILANHAPMMCALRAGRVRYRLEDDTERVVKHSAGVARVRDNTVTLLVDRAEVTENSTAKAAPEQ